MTINEIVKETISSLSKNRTIMTPENYAKMFCVVAKEKGVLVEDCQGMGRFIEKLNPSLQEDLGKYSVKTSDELITYLSATLNRLMGQSEGKQSLLLIALVKQLLKALTLLHNKEAKELSLASLERIEHLAEANTFTLVREKWEAFVAGADRGSIEKLKAYYDVSSEDFSEIVEELILLAHAKDDRTILEPLVTVILASLEPSIATSMEDSLATLRYELKNSPNILSTQEVQEEIQALIKERISLDKKSVKERITSLDTLLGDVSSKIINMIDKSNLSREKIKDIKTELISLDYSKHS